MYLITYLEVSRCPVSRRQMAFNFKNSKSDVHNNVKSTCLPNLKFLDALRAVEPLGGHIGDKWPPILNIPNLMDTAM